MYRDALIGLGEVWGEWIIELIYMLLEHQEARKGPEKCLSQTDASDFTVLNKKPYF